MTKENARSVKNKAQKLLRLYSQWQETRHENDRHAYMRILCEILSKNPNFNIRGIFQDAF